MNSPLKVFLDSRFNNIFLINTRWHELPFILPGEKFTIINNIDDITPGTLVPVLDYVGNIPEIVAQLGVKIADVIICILKVTHLAEVFNHHSMVEYYQDHWSEYNKNVLVIDTAIPTGPQHPYYIQYDFLWNRQKLYFTNYDNVSLEDRVWTQHQPRQTFMLTEIQKNTSSCKKFLAPNRAVYHDTYDVDLKLTRSHARESLTTHLTDEVAFFSDWTIDPKKILPCEGFELNHEKNNFHGWCPVANDIYNSSYISIYVETLAMKNSIRGITEKTFDPLIKGHYILPYGYPGLIEDIRSYGFFLPDWIDYTYDEEVSDHKRFNLFLREFYKLSSFPMSFFERQFNKELDRLYYNRNLFFTKPYDSLTEKLTRFFEKQTHDTLGNFCKQS